MNGKPSLFSELRRRNVFRVALTYAVVAWLLIEIASVFLPMVDAPQAIITAFVLLRLASRWRSSFRGLLK